MSILFKARGSSSFGLLIIRLAVGIYTLSLGIMQASNIESYINKIKSFQIFSDNTAFILGFILPFILIVFGALYIMGFFTPITSLVLSLVAFGKLITTGIFLSPGIPFSKDIIILSCYLLTLFSGAGMISFDALLDKKKKSHTHLPQEPKPSSQSGEANAPDEVKPENQSN